MSYYPQGGNEKPHVLTAVLSAWHGGVLWKLECPHEGARGCGMVEECNGTLKDVEKWGCELFPLAPSDYHEAAPASSEDWSKFEAARERWEDEVHGGNRWHRTDECWFEVALKERDFDPEEYLADLPQEVPIAGPLLVAVGYEGSDDDVEPKLKLWTKEEFGAEKS